MAEINIIPYVDVTFVLLVVFMVTAPLLMQGVQVTVVAVDSAPIKSNDNDSFNLGLYKRNLGCIVRSFKRLELRQ